MSCWSGTRSGCASRARCRSSAAGSLWRSRYRARPRALALPERARVAIDAADAARDRLTATLDTDVEIVPREAADVVLHDAAGSRDAYAAVAAGFSVPTLLFVDDPHAEIALAALRAGAAGVLARQSDAAEILAAIDAVRAGLLVLDPSVREAPVPIAAGGAALAEPLTDREQQVLTLLARGLSNRRVAERLAISDNTVKAHVAAILGKLGATTRTEAVTLAIRLGLVML
jgi:DNA-binding NarL/FixJ family response regulator